MSQTTTDDKLMPIEPEPNHGEPVSETRRDLQRAALRDLIDLTTECAEQEKQIERVKIESLAEADKKEKRGHSDLEHQSKSTREAVAQKYEERKLQIEGRFNSDNKAVEQADEAMRRRIRHEYDAVQRDVKTKYDQAHWLAESVLEASQNKCAIELKRAHELHIAHTELLDGKQRESVLLMDRYSQKAPPEIIASEVEGGAPTGPAMSFDERIKSIDRHLYMFQRLTLANLFVGARPYMIGMLVVIIAAIIPQALTKSLDPIQFAQIGIWAGAGLVVVIGVMVGLFTVAKKKIAETYAPLRIEIENAYRASKAFLDQAELDREANLAKATKQQKAEVQAAREKAAPTLDKATKKKDAAAKAAQDELSKKNAEIMQQRDTGLAELEKWRQAKLVDLKNRYESEQQSTAQKTRTRLQEIAQQHKESRDALETKWRDGLSRIQAPMGEGGQAITVGLGNWKDWAPPTKFPATVRFGELHIDPKTVIAEVAGESPFTLPLPENFTVPALMAFPKHASVLLHADRSGHEAAIQGLQTLMMRLLTSLPPGRVRFTLLDPVGLGQNFAGYMHLADYDDALVTNRIWTDSEQIDQRLANLTEHMETVIQKYLRNEFETIDDYNAQAGELAEPYRFLVIADFPVNFSDDAFRRLSSIASTGARCGVYTLIARDTRISTSHGTHLDDLEGHSINLVWEKDHFVWRDDIFRRFPLTLDAPPAEDELTELLHIVGKKAKEAKRVEVSFDSVAPKLSQFWTLKSSSDLGVAIGRSGATRLQTFRLGRGVAQHALVAGKTGSGKSTMLHALISNLAMWYSPDEIELYLIDFKKGVEFKTYAMHNLPHARAIAIESDREFGLSVLQRLDAELGRRGNLYRKYDVQDLASYRTASGEAMPRTLLVIDEFQEFFSEDDKLAQDASLLLDRLVRQGRAFGIHVLLGSQTIGGSSGLSRSTIGQIAVRIALQTSEADSQLILGDGNSAARLLSRPGEAIYNDAGGLVEGNSPFQVAYLNDDRKDQFLEMVSQKAKTEKAQFVPAIVFEGNAPADYRANGKMAALIESPNWPKTPMAPLAWLGDPVAIKDPTGIPFRRQNGANVLVIGQNDEAALAMMSVSIIGLAAQHAPDAASFYILDGSPADSPSFGALAKVASVIPHNVQNVEWKRVGDAMAELTKEYEARQSGESSHPPAIFVFIYGMQRYRMLRKQEDSFAFSSSSDEEKPADPGKQFTDLLREGPPLGIHFFGWVDTVTALDRALDRGAMREFDSRVLFQMSATDSSNLIDSPAANKLGVNRALAFSEEQGTIEKFRPYAVADATWLEHLKTRFAAKAPPEKKAGA